MSTATNIVRRPGSVNYYARMGVPKDLQVRLANKIGSRKRDFWKSLETTDPREAKRRARPILEAWEREIDRLRKPTKLTEAELQDAVWKRYVELITTDEKFRQGLPTESDLTDLWRHMEAEFGGVYELDAFRVLEMIRDEFDTEQRERARRFVKLRADTARGETEAVASIARRVIDERRLDLETGSAEYRKLAQGIQRAELEALSRAAERDAGDWAGVPKDKLVQPPTLVMHPPGETILELFDRYRKEAPSRVIHDTWDQSRKIVVLFDQFVGGKRHISELTRKNVREWKGKLFDWPVKAADTNAFKGLTFLQVIAKNEVVGKPVIIPKTINRYLSALGGFCTWLLANDFVKEDIMTGMYLDFDRSARTRLPYTDTQLAAIFSSPMFRTCAGTKKEHKHGQIEIRDWRYWVPWIALYSGMRLGEISQLLVSDVRQIHGQWVFHVTREGSKAKTVKTKGSERVVPMHSKLIELGFIDYHARANAAGSDSRLFPEIKIDTRYQTGAVSSFFNDYFTKIKVKQDRSVNFHSFRHCIADAFRRAGYYDEQFAPLLGHTKATTTGRYGIMSEMVLADRVKMIEAVEYEFITTQHSSTPTVIGKTAGVLF